MLNSNAKPYCCPLCNQGCRTKKCLQRHLKKHFQDNSFVCQICASSFSSRPELNAHRRTHNDGRPYKCSECAREFRRLDSLMQHVNVHWHVELKCDLCDKTFKNENSLTIHHSLHNGEKPYQCDLCDSAFACKEYLHSHRKKVHNVKNILYQCDTCEKIFKNGVGLKLHMISHSTDRPHICHLCPETYKHKTSLSEHLRRHVCPKPFVCQVCSKAFTSGAGLREHKRIHSSAREFQCEKCGKSYRRKAHLVIHSLSHGEEKRFACKYCGKRFRYKGGRSIHIRSHTGQRPYTCDLCGRRFAQKSRMKSHRMTHTGEKPFRCIACGKAFCRHDKLTDHCRRIHKQLIDIEKSSPFELQECKNGTSSGSNQSDAKDELDASCSKNKSERNPNHVIKAHAPTRKMNSSAGSNITRSKWNHENGGSVRNDETDSTLNPRRGKPTVIVTDGEEDCDMSLKIEVFDEAELPDDFYLADNSTEILTDIGDAEQEQDFRQCLQVTSASNGTTWPRFIAGEQTTSNEEVQKLTEQNNDESNKSTGSKSEVMDSDEAEEATDSDDITVHVLEDEDEGETAVDKATDDMPTDAAADGICFWSDNYSIQDDEDFLLAMRVFQFLKSHPPGAQKNSLKAQVEDMLLDANEKTSPI